MHLTPQHFQAQRRYQEDQTTRTLDLLFPFAYGLSAVAVDTDALRNGSFSLVMLRGVLPDGTSVYTPGGDVLPVPVSLAPRFSPTRDSHVIHLAVPRLRSNEANVHGADEGTVIEAGDRPPMRYQAIEERLVDVLGLLRGAIDEGGGGVDRRFGGALTRLRIIAVADRQGLQMQTGLVAHGGSA